MDIFYSISSTGGFYNIHACVKNCDGMCVVILLVSGHDDACQNITTGVHLNGAYPGVSDRRNEGPLVPRWYGWLGSLSPTIENCRDRSVVCCGRNRGNVSR